MQVETSKISILFPEKALPVTNIPDGNICECLVLKQKSD